MDGNGLPRDRIAREAIAANFADCAPALSRDEARIAAARCYFCHDAPCIEACPTSIDIPLFIRGIATGNLKGAALTILEANIFGGTCGRVCPTEILCERACVRTAQEEEPVAIGALQRHATDWLFAQNVQPFSRAPATGRRVAVVGAGPAGLSCAHGLARLGHAVTVFEAREKPGGLNEYGIAAYKLVDDFAQSEVAFILGLGGITVEYGRVLGEDITLAALRADFDAVFLGLGQAGANRLDLPGEDLPGVTDAIDFIADLREAADKSSLPVGRQVVVVGGGNTAIDAATQARKLGAEEVTIVYRRGPEAMSATREEQERALVNGVAIRHWATPVALEATAGRLVSVIFERTHPDTGGRAVLSGERFALAAQMLLKAIGQHFVAEPLGTDGPRLEGRRIVVDPAGQTSLPGVFAGGDCIAGQDLTVQAVEDGKNAARAIHRYFGC
ncbi:MAG: NAD(P)-dependent oxidoreductase [Acetobacteraceae bacterium]